ncbi:LCP family protein [Oerskovia sp. M15]
MPRLRRERPAERARLGRGLPPADGHTALAFSRMRYSDPKGDIGRAERQRQVIGAVSKKAADKSLLLKPGTQVSLIGAGLGSLVVDEKTGIVDLGKMALAFRAANGPDGITGTPPISNPDFRPGGVGSTVQLDPELSPTFWTDVRDGKLSAGSSAGCRSSLRTQTSRGPSGNGTGLSASAQVTGSCARSA